MNLIFVCCDRESGRRTYHFIRRILTYAETIAKSLNLSSSCTASSSMRIITQKNRLFRKKKQTKASTKNATTLLGNSEAGKQSNVPPVSMLAPSASIICSTLHFSRRLSSSSHYFCNNKNGKQLQRSIMSKAPAKDDNNETRPPRKVSVTTSTKRALPVSRGHCGN